VDESAEHDAEISGEHGASAAPADGVAVGLARGAVLLA